MGKNLSEYPVRVGSIIVEDMEHSNRSATVIDIRDDELHVVLNGNRDVDSYQFIWETDYYVLQDIYL